jgi:hypothetical protein
MHFMIGMKKEGAGALKHFEGSKPQRREDFSPKFNRLLQQKAFLHHNRPAYWTLQLFCLFRMISTSIVLRGMSNAIATLPLPRPISRLAKMHTCCPTHQQFAPFPQPSSRLFRLAATTLGSTSSRSNNHRNAHGAPLPPCGPNRRALVPASLAPRAAANKFDPQTPAASESQHSLRQRAALLALGAAALAGALISPSLAYAGEYRSNVGPFSPPIATIAAPAPAPLKAEPDPSALHESKAPLPSASELTADELAVVRLFQQNTPGVVGLIRMFFLFWLNNNIVVGFVCLAGWARPPFREGNLACQT